MNIYFAPFIEPRMGIRWMDCPTRLTDRFQRIFLEATDNEVTRTPNYQTLLVLGELAVVTGLVGTVASLYFQSFEYLPHCVTNIAVGAVAMERALRS